MASQPEKEKFISSPNFPIRENPIQGINQVAAAAKPLAFLPFPFGLKSPCPRLL
jgi:hypothetical protein